MPTYLNLLFGRESQVVEGYLIVGQEALDGGYCVEGSPEEELGCRKDHGRLGKVLVQLNERRVHVADTEPLKVRKIRAHVEIGRAKRLKRYVLL